MAFLIGILLTLACLLIISYPLIKTRFSIITSVPNDPIYDLTNIRQLIVSEIARLENQSSSGGPDPDHSKIVLDKLKNDLNLNLKREYMLISQLDHIKLDQTLSLEPAVEKKVQEIRILIGAGSPKSNFCVHCVLEHEHGTIACTKCGYLTIHTSSSKGRLR